MGKYNEKTKLKALVKDPATRKILEDTFPMDLEAATTKVAYGMTIEKCLSFPQVELSDEEKKELMDKIKAVE